MKVSLYQLKIERLFVEVEEVVTVFMSFQRLDAALSQQDSFIEVAEEQAMAIRTTVIVDQQQRKPKCSSAYPIREESAA